jgi:hypothetical protein
MLVFVHINKTAGSTMRYILRSSYGSRHCDVEPWQGTEDGEPFAADDLRRLRKIYRRLSSIAGHRITGYVDLPDDGDALRYFTFLRDPLRMCASRFQYHIDHRGKKGLVFDEWIERDWLRNAQTKRIAGVESAAEAIRIIERKEMFVGLTEQFDESIVLLKGLRADDLDIDYRPVNVARRNTIAQGLLADERKRAALADANREDLALYAYVTNELYPSYRRAFGPTLPDAVAQYRATSRQDWRRAKLVASRVKQHAVYRPLLHAYRARPAVGALRTVLR